VTFERLNPGLNLAKRKTQTGKKEVQKGETWVPHLLLKIVVSTKMGGPAPGKMREDVQSGLRMVTTAPKLTKMNLRRDKTRCPGGVGGGEYAKKRRRK